MGITVTTFHRKDRVISLVRWGNIPVGSVGIYIEECNCSEPARCSYGIVNFSGVWDRTTIAQKDLARYQEPTLDWFDIWGT